eukprot:c43523_g1_i1 orf=1-312(-)
MSLPIPCSYLFQIPTTHPLFAFLHIKALLSPIHLSFFGPNSNHLYLYKPFSPYEALITQASKMKPCTQCACYVIEQHKFNYPCMFMIHLHTKGERNLFMPLHIP